MLLDLNNPVKSIVSVDHIRWGAQSCRVDARGYSALAFRVRGRAAIRYRGKTVTAGPNDLLYLPQGIAYRAEYGETEIIVIHFITAFPDDAVEVFPVRGTDRVYPLFLKALEIWQGKAPGFEAFTTAVLFEILGTLLSDRQKADLPRSFREAVSSLHSRYREPDLSVAAICRDAGISETHFRKLFARHYGKTPVAYLTELRLAYARTLISNGSPVERAALTSGFRDAKYFARVVKRRWGCTPRQLRLFGK